MSTSLPDGAGRGTRVIDRTSGPPYRSCVTALIVSVTGGVGWCVMAGLGIVDSYVVRLRYRTTYETGTAGIDQEDRMAGTAERANRPRVRRQRLSRDRVLRAAVAIADAGGLGSLTIRSVAGELGAKPMSVYYHVASKEEILDGLVDLVFAEVELPDPGGEWRTELTRRADSARAVLRRHRWAIGLLESRTRPGPANPRDPHPGLAHFRARGARARVPAPFGAAGSPAALTAHAYALIDSYVYGFALQEASLPFEGTDSVGDIAAPIMERMAAGDHPHLAEMATSYYLQPGYDFGDEFRFGLDLILDGIAAALVSGPR